MVKNVKQLLFAPLDWGMGHTTRCIPVIRYLQLLGHQVTFAGNAAQCALIKKNISISTILLDGYNVTYSKKRSTFALRLLWQVPRILKTIRAEHRWLHEELSQSHYDGVITDNRYGLYTRLAPAVIMTHQLRIQTGMGNLADSIVQKLHYRLLSRFAARWVVDVPGASNLAGALSHPAHMPANTHYVGLLSQMDDPKPVTPVTDTILILLSGPEPQRTILFQKLWQQATQYTRPIVFVAGNAGAPTPAYVPGHIIWHTELGQVALQDVMARAEVVICRAGYSTIMDLVLLKKKAILIPTPGQLEQEYLASYLSRQNLFYSRSQQKIDLQKDIEIVKKIDFTQPHIDKRFNEFIPVVDRWLANLQV